MIDSPTRIDARRLVSWPMTGPPSTSTGAGEGEPAIGRGRWQQFIVSLLVFAFAALLTVVFGDTVWDIDYHEMIHGLRHLPGIAVAGSIAATIIAYAAFVGREASAVRARQRARFWRLFRRRGPLSHLWRRGSSRL